jgi:hypothetical protein
LCARLLTFFVTRRKVVMVKREGEEQSLR